MELGSEEAKIHRIWGPGSARVRSKEKLFRLKGDNRMFMKFRVKFVKNRHK